MSDIQVGDVVVCVDDSRQAKGSAGRLNFPAVWVVRGRHYTVSAIVPTIDGLTLNLFEAPVTAPGCGWCPTRFRKIEAPSTDVSELIKRCRPVKTVEPAPVDTDRMAETRSERLVPVPGYEGLYLVSDEGRVLSKARQGALSPVADSSGYATVKLYNRGVGTRFKVNRLVCESFNGPPPSLDAQAAHLDGDKTNNRAGNLRWVSPKENTAHKRAHGTHQAGERHPRAKLSAQQVVEIRAKAFAGQSASSIGREYGVHRTTVGQIRDGLRWKTEAGQAPLCPSEHHRSIIYSSLIYDIFSPAGGACLTSGPVSGQQEENNDRR